MLLCKTDVEAFSFVAGDIYLERKKVHGFSGSCKLGLELGRDELAWFCGMAHMK